MRTLRFLAVMLMLAGCKDSGLTSSVDGVYDVVVEGRSANLPPQPPIFFPMAGAVAPDGSGYFAFTGMSYGSNLLHFTNLMHPGPDSIAFDITGGEGFLVPVNVKPAAGGGYKFSYQIGHTDFTDTYSFTSDPITDQPRPMAALAGSYQGFDIFESHQQQVTGTLDQTGKLTANGDGCDISAQLSQVNDKNLYTVALQFSGGTGCDVPVMNGVAWIGDTDLSGLSPNKGTYLNIIALDEKFDTALMLRLL